jgi:hypothetical protein
MACGALRVGQARVHLVDAVVEVCELILFLLVNITYDGDLVSDNLHVWSSEVFEGDYTSKTSTVKHITSVRQKM